MLALIQATGYSMSLYDTLYCVTISKHTKKVYVSCIGINCVDNELEDVYTSTDELPTWVQNKMAVLMLVDKGKLEGIGYRIEDKKFYIYK
jgi:hypothetical protein